jgi:hypothetical protein
MAEGTYTDARLRTGSATRGGAFRSPATLAERRRAAPAAVLGEVVGTFLLIFLGCGSVIAFTERAGRATRIYWPSRWAGASPCSPWSTRSATCQARTSTRP